MVCVFARGHCVPYTAGATSGAPLGGEILRRNFKVKDDILRNANWECELCGSSENLQVHHRDLDKSNNSPDNAQVLCLPCHQEAHGMWTKRLEDERRKKDHAESVKVECLAKDAWVSKGRSKSEIGSAEYDIFSRNWLVEYYRGK